MKKYNLFIPPLSLAEKGVKNWNKKEAKQYFDWFLHEKENRVKGLLSYLDYELTGDIERDIQVIGNKVFDLVNQNNFHDIRPIDNGKKLNDSGLALVTDFGLLIANLLERSNPNLKWAIGGKPKSYHSYNLPVLTGFNNGEWDFIFTSINKHGFSLNELKSVYDWVSFYKELNNKAK